jgi:hypothetical protein
MKPLLLLLFALSLAVCTNEIKMVNPRTGQTAKCGPFVDTVNAPPREAQCISDYQRQGFERAP